MKTMRSYFAEECQTWRLTQSRMSLAMGIPNLVRKRKSAAVDGASAAAPRKKTRKPETETEASIKAKG